MAAAARPSDIQRLAAEASDFGFAAVCVNPLFVRIAAERLAGTPVAVAAVVGFPLGATPSANKVQEALLAVSHGATEIDMVIPLGLLREGNGSGVSDDVAAVRDALPAEVVLKAIIEAPLWSEKEIVLASQRVVEAGADYVKTGTGHSGPATREQVEVIRRAVGDGARIKAAGGIRNAATALALIRAGADRLGTSHARALVVDALPDNS